MKKGYLPKAEFDSIFSKVPRACVELIVHTPEGIVLTKRNIEPAKGMWHYPGGTILLGERAVDTVARTAKDELGVEVKINKVLGYAEYPKLWADGYTGWPVGIVFDVTITSGELKNLDQADDIGCFKSVPENTIPDHADYLNKNVFID
jgi:ADP-ribose pyrophosphatase YjhB (NUDIX family)